MRFRTRHLQKTVAAFLEAEFATLGWTGPTVNFGTPAVTFAEVEPEGAGQVVAPNTVSVTLGDTPPQLEEELGGGTGGLVSVSLPLFVDIYGATQTMAECIASDVHTLLTNRTLAILDFTTTALGEASTDTAELEMVTVVRPDASYGASDYRRCWRVVKAMAHVYYLD